MIRHLTLTLIAAFALGACGAGDRRAEEEEPVVNPTASTPRPAPSQPVPEAPPAPEAVETAPEDRGPAGMVHPTERLYTVQIAAYLSADSARALSARLEQRGLPTWMMEVRVGDRTYHRIRVGAHPQLREARKLGQRLSTQFRQEVWIAPVDMSSRIPANAVEQTRALLGG